MTVCEDEVGGGGIGDGYTPDPDADKIREFFDKDCFKISFNNIMNTINSTGTPIMHTLKKALDNSTMTFDWKNGALGTSNNNNYSTSAANTNASGGYDITLNSSLLSTASNEFITATILNSYFQAYTMATNNIWANDLLILTDAMDAMANGLRILHPNLPMGAEYAIALKALYDGNGALLNQTIVASNLNQYYNNLINNGKIPMTANGLNPAPDYDGWQVAKNNVGAKYATNSTSGVPAQCN
jgi:hypothetical protein